MATSPRAPLALAAVLAAVLGWQLGALIWLALPDPGEGATPSLPDTSTAGAAGASDTGPGESPLAARGLFGEAPEEEADASAAPGPEKAPETQLNLTLRGVLTLGDGNGFAFIVTGRGEESVYSPGETLPGDATLERVYRDRVLLSRRGSLETLWLDREDPGAAASSGTGRQQGGTVPEDFDRQRASETATALRARLREQPAELMRMVQFEPYQQNGELQGFRLQPRGDVNERVLRGLGLTPNDVVTSINGIPLSERSRLGEVLNVLGRADQARVRFLRNGEARRINIPMGDGG